jgi:hypothetical protein
MQWCALNIGSNGDLSDAICTRSTQTRAVSGNGSDMSVLGTQTRKDVRKTLL